jgi:hypothetical protein
MEEKEWNDMKLNEKYQGILPIINTLFHEIPILCITHMK